MWKKIGIFLLAIWAFVAILNAILPEPPTPTKEEQLKVDSIKKENEAIEKKNDEIMMAYVSAERFLKKNLKDPDSYEEIETEKYFVTQVKGKKKPYIQIKIKYRAKNSFGGYNVETRAFNFDKDLNMIDTFESK